MALEISPPEKGGQVVDHLGHQPDRQPPRGDAISLTFILIALVAAWCILYLWLYIAAVVLTNPYYEARASQMPPLGSFEYSSYQFFVNGIGSLLPASICVGASVVAFCLRLVRSRRALLLSMFFIVSIFSFLVANFISLIFSVWITKIIFPWQSVEPDLGFHRTAVFTGVTIMSLVVLIALQARLDLAKMRRLFAIIPAPLTGPLIKEH